MRRRRALLLSTLVLAVSGSFAVGVTAQVPEMPAVTPPELHLGQVRKGATVESTVGIRFERAKKEGVALSVEPPEGVSVERTEYIHATRHVDGAMLPMTYLRVSIAVDTSEAGERSGTLGVKLGSEAHEIPFSVRVVEPSPTAIRLHIVDPPVSDLSRNLPMLELWTDLIAAGNFDPQYVDSRPPRVCFLNRGLDECDAAVITSRALMVAREDDVEHLAEWVEKGGRAVVFITGDFSQAVEALRPLADKAGIALESSRVQVPALVEETHIADDPLTDGIGAVGWFHPTTISVNPGSKAKLLVLNPSDGQRGFAAVGPVGKGELIVISDSDAGHWLSRYDEQGTENVDLMRNFLTVGLPRKKEGEAPAPPPGKPTL